MASSLGRSLYVGLKADTKGFGRSLSKAEKRMQMFKNTAKVAGAAIAASFAAMGAAALLFGKSAVTAAIEDQKAMKQLGRTVKNNTKITKDYQHTVEKSVTALQNQFNVADDKLRPAFSKLIVATKSVNKSQKLMRVALDVSAGTGKSLDTVVGALSRAYLGNNTALGRLGVGIDKAKLKNMSFDEIIKVLSHTMNGQAKDAANSYAGSVEGLKIAWNEFQESVGYAILPKLKTLLNYIKTDLMPWLGEVKKGFEGTPTETISPQLRKVSKAMGLNPDNPKSSAYGLGESLKTMAVSFQKLFDGLSSSKSADGASTLDTIAGALTNFANAITKVTDAIDKISGVWNNIPGPLRSLLLDPLRIGSTLSNLSQSYGTFKNGMSGNSSLSTQASGGPVRGGRAYLVGENGPEMFVPSSNGGIRTASQTRSMAGGGTIINLNGIVDAESARRSIERLMQRSGLRTGQVNLNGAIF